MRIVVSNMAGRSAQEGLVLKKGSAAYTEVLAKETGEFAESIHIGVKSARIFSCW